MCADKDNCGRCEGCGGKICTKCEKCSECTSARHCKDCGACDKCTVLCLECEVICDNCTKFCPTCHTCHECSENYCQSCDVCDDEAKICAQCNRKCSSCSLICKGCGEVCLECADEWCGKCEKCGNCADWVCPNIDACSNCSTGDVTHCEGCGLCIDCEPIICMNCLDMCNSCGTVCKTCWLVCNECGEVCPSCELCADCGPGKEYCEICRTCSDCTTLCPECDSICESCADLCPDCGRCDDCAGLCPDCGKCSVCAGQCGGCGRCESCAGQICEECGNHCEKCSELCSDCNLCEDCGGVRCPGCGKCAGCVDGMCQFCGYCGDCVTVCADCGEVCSDCMDLCPDCKKCSTCVSGLDCPDCGRCEDCCAMNSESAGCDHDICTESSQWKTHFCTAGNHCVGTPVGPEHNSLTHWYRCGEGCTVRLGEESHSFGAGTVTREPTTEQAGIMTIPCTGCDYKKNEMIPKLTGTHTHEYMSAVTPPTCTEKGFTTHTCDCGHSYIDSTVPAAGHSYVMRYDASGHFEECSVCTDKKPVTAHKFGAWEITVPATYSAPGERQRKCVTCEYVETEVIPQLAAVGQYVIRMEDENGDLLGELLTTGKEHLVPTLPAHEAKPTGNFFDGWRNKADNKVVSKGQKLDGSITIFPVWKDCGDENHIDADKNSVCDVCGKKLTVLFNITIDGGVFVSGVTDGKAAAGSTVKVMAEDRAGYSFSKWTVLSGSIGSVSLKDKVLSFTMPYSDVSLKANYTADIIIPPMPPETTYHTITASAGINGSVSPSGSVSVREGGNQTFSITPYEGFAVADVMIDGKSIGVVSVYTFENVVSSHSIEASFIKVDTHTAVFTDVPAGSYYEEAVSWAAGKGITTGTSDMTFDPESVCTRAQIVTFLWRAAGSPEPMNMSDFTDVPKDAYYAKAVAWAVENGITLGIGGGKFDPDAACIRAQAVTFLYRASGSPAVSDFATFSDVAKDSYYVAAVAWAEKNGITIGIGGGMFGSDDNCTRAQIITFLWRCMK